MIGFKRAKLTQYIEDRQIEGVMVVAFGPVEDRWEKLPKRMQSSRKGTFFAKRLLLPPEKRTSSRKGFIRANRRVILHYVQRFGIDHAAWWVQKEWEA